MTMKSSARIVGALAASAIVVTGTLLPLPDAIAPAAASPSAAPLVEQPLPTLTYDDVEQWAEMLVDGEDVERDAEGLPFNTFGGFGSVSCNNTSNLLLDYKEEQPDVYWRIMRMLFDPESGAGLGHIKVELGADNNTSSGAEPATKRSADEPANVLRGAGFHFIADAQSINPDIEVEALRWGEPSWTQGEPDLRYQWYKETIDAAYDTYGVEFDYLSPAQNEVHANYIGAELDWTVDFAERLDADAAADGARYDYSGIKIVALDSYRNVGAVSRAILANPAALEQVDAVGYHYDIAGDPALTRLNKEFGMEVLYSEGVSPMIDPEYRIEAEPARGGIGGTVGAVDIADRFINAYSWAGSAADPGHMTTFLFQPAVSAMYEGSQYSPKHLIRASDPWSGYYEGGVGITMVRHFMQFIGEDWEYIEGASGGDGQKGDGGTVVDTSTRTALTLRTPQAEVEAGAELEFSQVQANNTSRVRNFEVKVANLDVEDDTALAVWETRGPDEGEAVDANHFQRIGQVVPVRAETIDGVEHQVYRVQVQPYSIVTLSTLADGVHGGTAEYRSGDWAAEGEDTVLPLPYRDDFEYADYGTEAIGGVEMDYVERRGGSPRYTADQNGAFEVVAAEGDRGNVLEQRIHAGNRGYTWNVWGDGSQRNVSTANPATVLGDHSWTNYTATIDFSLDGVVRDASLDNFAGLGVRQVVAEGTDLASYSARVHADGRWELRKLSSTVASGSVFLFDPSEWHELQIEARENVITLRLDGRELGSYADTAPNPTMSGRVAILSGYANTRYDDLRIEPIEGLSWEAARIDDADSRIDYPQGFSFTQAGYAHLNRTQHVLSAGRSFAFDAEGTGFNLLGATGAATLSVQVDDDPARTVAVGPTGNRQTSYWVRGLEDGAHRVSVTVQSGTFVLDGVDVVRGGAGAGPVDPERRPVEQLAALPRATAWEGESPQLPETVRARSEAGGEIDAPVTWRVSPGSFGEPYALMKVDGVFDDNPSLAVSAHVEVLPRGLRYLVDANAPAGAPVFPAVAGAASETIVNDRADRVFDTASGWGRAGAATAKGRLNQVPYDKLRETGWYSSGAGTPVVYRFSLPAGEYDIASGHTEWWNPGPNRSRAVSTSVQFTAADGSVVDRAIGSHRFDNGAIGTSAVLRGGFVLEQDTIVTFTVAGTGGTEAPAVSWIGIDDAGGTIDRSALDEQLERAEGAVKRAYTPESWELLRVAGTAALAVRDDAGAEQDAIDAAAAALAEALDGLVEVAYLPLDDYRSAAVSGAEPDLPETVVLRTVSGVEQQVAVQWGDAPERLEPYATATVDGIADGTAVRLVLESVPEDVAYFIDAAAGPGHDGDAGVDSPSHRAVLAARGEGLLNALPDAPFDEQSRWGLLNPIDEGDRFVGAKALVPGVYDKGRSTGWWASAGASVDYRLTLPAGEWELVSGYREWWGQTREIAPSVTVGEEVVAGEPVRLSSASPDGRSAIRFALDAETTVLFSAARGEGAADPVLSWLAVAPVAERAPSAPTDLRAAIEGAAVQLAWSAPEDEGSAAVDGYRVHRSDSDEVLCETTATECRIEGLEGTTASFTVVAFSAVGEGVRSAPTEPIAVPEVPADDARSAPGRGVLSSDDGWDDGRRDGAFTLTMNLWWGENASLMKLFRDGELVARVPLERATPSAQRATVPITGLEDGTYVFTAELVNSRGATPTVPLTVRVTDAKPGAPALTHDNWSGGGSFTVTANLWWGTNATSYRFRENGAVVAEGELDAGSPAAQRATLPVSGRASGEYVYVVEFANAAGVTTSAPITVRVR